MTVKQMMEMLATMPMDADVCVMDGRDGSCACKVYLETDPDGDMTVYVEAD